MSLSEMLIMTAATLAICAPALYWVLREARADMASLTDDEDVLY